MKFTHLFSVLLLVTVLAIIDKSIAQPPGVVEPVTDGRSGYNRRDTAETDGRSGYNRRSTEEEDGRSGYNRRNTEEEDGRSGYNRRN
ncbi:hypothetical protein K466DRAFT_596269 [Polyporus arcularius HHB13444]|uniref:Uncharacterized protein n=1 Tax=Polyporus arcularius HHB13444 TaxID=1314778 RepID=A0A5C3PPL2_9APHY|nr:hypothetical protein K466DRAFT_596269 [Polyporus arcularius HHB13444]